MRPRARRCLVCAKHRKEPLGRASNCRSTTGKGEVNLWRRRQLYGSTRQSFDISTQITISGAAVLLTLST